MGLYVTYSPDIRNRKSKVIFDFQNGNCFLFGGRRKPSVVFEAKHDNIDLYQKLVNYAFDRHLDSYEIILPVSQNIAELLVFLTHYLEDKDISIGLITSDSSFIDNNSNLLDGFGITRSRGVASTESLFEPEITGTPIFEKPKKKKFVAAVPKASVPFERKSTRALQKTRAIELEKSFHDRFLDLLIESGKENVEIYKKAGVTRQVFSKILSDRDMIPSKLTLISLCIGLELPLKEAKELMVSAGYSLSKSILLDAIVMKYVSAEIYDFELINSELDEYGCQLLGWHPREN